MINQRSERPGPFPPPVDGFYERLDEGARQMLDQSLAYAVIGGPDKVRAGLKAFAARTGADELIISCQVFDHAAAQRSFEIALRAWATSAPSSSDGPASRRKTRPRPWPALSPRQYPFDTSFRCLRSLSRTTRVSS